MDLIFCLFDSLIALFKFLFFPLSLFLFIWMPPMFTLDANEHLTRANIPPQNHTHAANTEIERENKSYRNILQDWVADDDEKMARNKVSIKWICWFLCSSSLFALHITCIQKYGVQSIDVSLLLVCFSFSFLYMHFAFFLTLSIVIFSNSSLQAAFVRRPIDRKWDIATINASHLVFIMSKNMLFTLHNRPGAKKSALFFSFFSTLLAVTWNTQRAPPITAWHAHFINLFPARNFFIVNFIVDYKSRFHFDVTDTHSLTNAVTLKDSDIELENSLACRMNKKFLEGKITDQTIETTILKQM